jgi:hypothetical protein
VAPLWLLQDVNITLNQRMTGNPSAALAYNDVALSVDSRCRSGGTR